MAERLAFITGTGTEVGKTWLGCAIARAHPIVARKPAQSYEPGTPISATDAGLLAAATGDEPATVCPRHRWYETALAPVMAAEQLDAPPFTIADLLGELAWPESTPLGIVEGAGGVRSPLALDGDNADFAAALAPDVIILVAEAGLGAINNVRLAHAALAPIAPVLVFLNRADDDTAHLNRRWLRDRDGFWVTTDVGDVVAAAMTVGTRKR